MLPLVGCGPALVAAATGAVLAAVLAVAVALPAPRPAAVVGAGAVAVPGLTAADVTGGAGFTAAPLSDVTGFDFIASAFCISCHHL